MKILDFIYGILIVKNKKIINTENAPKAIGPYSQAIKVNNLLFTSGQIPLNPVSGQIVSNDFSKQTLQCLENIKGILSDQSLSLNHIVKITVYLIDLSNFEKLNIIFESFFKNKQYPARSVVEVSRLPKDVKIEIEAICYNEN